jgi:hypothetical protein
MKTLSVAICTRNPRPDYLERVLVALRQQTLPLSDWELVLVDNQSEPPLAGRCDLAWHPAARVVPEPRPGLTPARLRGIAATTAPLVVFVDDDNVLAPDYLAAAGVLAGEHARLGAWSGQVLPEFEVPPPPALKPWLHLLCLRQFGRDDWGNHTDSARLPFGAGMCVRRTVAEQYARELQTHPARMALDRTGDLLYCSGDLDLGMTAVAMGLGTGLFCRLKVTHLIPKRRLEEAYLLKLTCHGAASYVVFNQVWGLKPALAGGQADRLLAVYKYWRASAAQRRFARAMRQGEALGRRLVGELLGPEGRQTSHA